MKNPPISNPAPAPAATCPAVKSSPCIVAAIGTDAAPVADPARPACPVSCNMPRVPASAFAVISPRAACTPDTGNDNAIMPTSPPNFHPGRNSVAASTASYSSKCLPSDLYTAS